MKSLYKLVMEEEREYILSKIIKDYKSMVEIYTDNAGNIIFHKQGTGKKIMISAVVSQPRVCISDVNENKAEFALIGDIKNTSISDREVKNKNISIGIIREKNDEKSTQLIELWKDVSVNKGDILAVDSNVNRKGNLVYGFSVATVIPLKIVLNCIDLLSESVNDIYFTVSFSENSAQTAVNILKPNSICYIYCAESDEKFKISSGCGIVFKDGNAVIDIKLREKFINIADKLEIKHQAYIGKRSKLVEKFAITGNGSKVEAICIPVEHLGSGCEIADVTDITAASKLLAKALKG